MFPKTLFPVNPFPNQIFPFGIGLLTHAYSDILLYVQQILFESEVFGPVRSPITLHEEPYPIAGGPIAYIMPEESETIESQHFGDGRYFFGFDGYFTVRVVGESLKDYTQTDTLRLSDSTTGLLRLSHKVIDLLDIQFGIKSKSDLPAPLFPNELFPARLFPSKLFPRSIETIERITEEPIVLVSHSPVRVRRRAENYSGIDLKFKAPYALTFQNPIELDDPISDRPYPSNMADILLSVKSKIVDQQFLNQWQTMITLTEDPFPLTGGPFCAIRPERFNMVSKDKYGAGRDYASMEGTFTVSPVIQNITDITEYANNSLSGSSSTLSLYSCAQYLTERLALSFLHDPEGKFIVETPLDLTRIGKPRYYKHAENYVTIPLTFKLRYQEDLS